MSEQACVRVRAFLTNVYDNALVLWGAVTDKSLVQKGHRFDPLDRQEKRGRTE